LHNEGFKVLNTVLVTGANRGIGLEICRRLVKRGDSVICVCRQASTELDTLGQRIESGIDVSHPASLKALRGRLTGIPIDILINNAGVLENQRLGEIDASALDSMRRQYEINSLGPVLVTQALVENLHPGSKVAIVTSRMGSMTDNSSGGHYGYRMSKAAVNAAGVSLAHDLKARDIAVVLLHPGYVQTDMTQRQGTVNPADAAANLLERIDELTLEGTGQFRHANGEALPW
jgi:NAD(P)-dependent dehydrogenase (short-subunit alcohol dehydrogenase family)